MKEREETSQFKRNAGDASDKLRLKDLEHEEAINALNRVKQESAAELNQATEHLKEVKASLQEQRSYCDELQKQLQSARQDNEQ